jgi:glycosyltransferase involved in cell wall biosynthesis
MMIFYFAALELGKPDAANRHTIEVCQHLAQCGHQILLFAPFKRSPKTTLDPRIQIIPVPVYYCQKQLIISLSYYFFLPWVAWRYFVRLHPKVVYCRSSFLDFIAVSVLRIFFRFTYVAEINGIRSLETTESYTKRYLISWMERISIGLCDKAIAVTPELREWVLKIGKMRVEQTETIGNGVSVELFHPIPSLQAKQLLGLDLNMRYLTFTSSLKPWHDNQILIEALSKILSEFPSGIRLLIVGDGPEKMRLVELARRLGVNHAIDWIGRVSINKVPLYINAGEICLAPFTVERNVQTGISPIKIFEYMACSRPFITTRVETTYDNLIEACHCGVLVPPNDTTALAAAVVKLLQNPKKCARMGQQGRRIAIERYSWARIAEQIEQFITRPLILSKKQNFGS